MSLESRVTVEKKVYGKRSVICSVICTERQYIVQDLCKYLCGEIYSIYGCDRRTLRSSGGWTEKMVLEKVMEQRKEKRVCLCFFAFLYFLEAIEEDKGNAVNRLLGEKIGGARECKKYIGTCWKRRFVIVRIEKSVWCVERGKGEVLGDKYWVHEQVPV
ncbi:hypothetical protein PMAC_002525 [Pneumocystis sp. 'macacae']|nr:hypothetical protein PMAC_002525 [Pneumocystis sp. 'macacae']